MSFVQDCGSQTVNLQILLVEHHLADPNAYPVEASKFSCPPECFVAIKSVPERNSIDKITE